MDSTYIDVCLSDCMSKEDPFEELVDECYICMEVCSTPSPCLCENFVHKKCLHTFREMSGNEHCTVCLAKYTPAKPDYKKIVLKAALFLALYILAGIIGQLIWDAMSHISVEIKPPWSSEHFLGAVAIGTIILFGNSFVNRYRISV